MFVKAIFLHILTVYDSHILNDNGQVLKSKDTGTVM